MRKFNAFVLKLIGIKTDTINMPPELKKCVLLFAPHTSYIDFVIGAMCINYMGFKATLLIKKEAFFWPLGPIFRKWGGIPVWRSKHTSMTDNLAAEAQKMDEFKLCITPEGTRSPNADWKKGFYFIAMKANLPILLYGIDYQKRLIQCTKVIIPDGNVEQQMAEIKEYFKDFSGKHPENFTV